MIPRLKNCEMHSSFQCLAYSDQVLVIHEEFFVKKAVLDILVCPNCLPEERELSAEVAEEKDHDILQGRLICGHCSMVFPIEDGLAFLDPGAFVGRAGGNRYETAPVVSSYLWSHYGDLMHDGEASDAYSRWAGLMEPLGGYCLDIGGAVGRFAFEMTSKSDFVIGIDNSTAFIRAARELMRHQRMEVPLALEGLLTRDLTLELPEEWDMKKLEFIVGDALALPFKGGVFTSLASLNLVDKVPSPLKHLYEMNRVARAQKAAFLFSDPFSWSEEVAEQEEWLGGKGAGRFAGRGVDNIASILNGDGGVLTPPWSVKDRGHVWWKIRTHANHFELIRSCFVKAER